MNICRENSLRGEIPASNVVHAGGVNQSHTVNANSDSRKKGAETQAALKGLKRRIAGLGEKIKENEDILQDDLVSLLCAREDFEKTANKLPKLLSRDKLREYVLSKSHLNNLNGDIVVYANEIEERESLIKETDEEISQLKQQYTQLSNSARKG